MGLQTSVGENKGEEGARRRLFSDGVSLLPPAEVTSSTSVSEAGDLEVELTWRNQNKFSDNSSLPLLLKLYGESADGSADGEPGQLLEERKIESGVDRIRVPLDDSVKPWQVSFTLETDLPGLPSVASDITGLLSRPGLSLAPPHMITGDSISSIGPMSPHVITGVVCNDSSLCSFGWCHQNFFNVSVCTV